MSKNLKNIFQFKLKLCYEQTLFQPLDAKNPIFELLSNYPETGALKNDLADKTIRIYSIKKNFVIAYRVKDNKIEILRILTRYQNIFAVLN